MENGDFLLAFIYARGANHFVAVLAKEALPSGGVAPERLESALSRRTLVLCSGLKH